jgi:RHH-type proline utilization regulon transcriptional repressor/proline dehydrogenase/delta 1-pyrroline-5-carboxylate dehydrogenase
MFRNEPLTDFTIAENRTAFDSALSALDKELLSGRFYALPIINANEITTSEVIETFDPSDTEILVGRVKYAGITEVKEALTTVKKGFPAWKNTSVKKRAEILKNAGKIMREKKTFLSALIIREGGKPWKEADADVAEAIDFCNYYAEEILRLSTPVKTSNVQGEENIYLYRPRGIAVIIAPWNFPLAIACGMTTAALACGNAAILKPAEQTSLIAFQFAKILLEAGVPSDAFAFLPGRGEIIGKALVESADTAVICFTGSKPVGLEILKVSAVLQPGQNHIKKTITELGGKNCIIIDEDADLDEAIKGVLYSAFGYAGQKCSACSRLVILADIYENFLKRLSEATEDLIIGPAKDPSSYFGPVIDKESQDRILKTISEGEKSLKLCVKTSCPDKGYYVPAVIFRDLAEDHAIWKEEIFGPVLACMKADNFEHALKIANNSQYALTGGLFSRSPQNIERAYREFEAGNLYINRSCTGAMVCRQPFGGYKLSGIGSKAGGPDYLIQFMEPVSITENTMRRGFAPEVPGE